MRTEVLQSTKGVSSRAIIIGLVCAAAACLIAPYNDYVVMGVFSSGGHFPVLPFFVLTLLILIVNVILKNINPKLILSPQELITIWCMMAAASGIPCSGLMRYSLSPLVSYKYYATPENEWETLFYHHIPQWRVVQDENAIKGFFEGASFGESIPWRAWMIPLSIWTMYVLVMYFVMTCLATALRKQWVEIERCTFPLVQLPVEVSRLPQGQSLLNSFFKSKAMWIGFSIPAFIHTLNCLHAFFPGIPHIPLHIWIHPYFVSKPWNVLRPLKVFVVWSMVGFSYLLTLEVSLSLWLFFLIFKFECLIGAILGFRITSGPGVQWTGYSFSAAQEAGACLTFAAVIVWKSRHHIKNMLRGTFYREHYASNGSNEAMPYRLIILGLIMGVLVLSFLNHLMGMSFAFSLTFVLFLLGTYMVLTWQIINGGIPFINPSFSPQSFFLTTLGPANIRPSTMTSLLMHSISLTLDLREFMMPYVMNGLKAADEVKANRRRLLMGMGAAMVVGLVVSYYSIMKLCYGRGAQHLMAGGSWYMRQLDSILSNPTVGTNWANTGFIIFGSAFVLFLVWIRGVFVWWPLHPIGYTMFSSWATFQLWFSIFLGWAMKYSILKYGGLKVYRQARPVFLGLIFGEMVCAGIWMTIGMITGVHTGYRILWF